MQNKSPYASIVFFLLIWPLFTGCYSYFAATPPSFYDGPEEKYFKNLKCEYETQLEQNYFESLICHSRTQLDNKFTFELAPESQLRVEGFNPKDKDEDLKAPLLLRFVWFSDVQFRQRELKLGSNFFSRLLDYSIASAERNRAQEDFHWAVYFSQIEATNRLHRVSPLDSMIHTGDSIDTGSIEELYQFIYISDLLEIPWLNLIGNHDITILGNYKERLGYGRDPGVMFHPVGDPDNFIWMHRAPRVISGFGRYLLPTPAKSAHKPSVNTWLGKKLPPTSHHGFDLNSGRTPGDYSIDLRETSIPIRLIALNSAKKDKAGAKGSIDPQKQRPWLKDELLPANKGINLVFIHHSPEDFDLGTQALLSSPSNGPLVLFSGHTHQHHLKEHTGRDGGRYYELDTGSVLEFPQIGRLIELRATPGGPVWLVSRALGNTLMPLRERPGDDLINAVVKDCLQKERRDAKRENIGEAVLCGHYGAVADYRKDKTHFWQESPQPFREAWKNANVIIPVSR